MARDEAKKIAEDRSGFCTRKNDHVLESQRFVIKVCIPYEQVGHLVNYKSERLDSVQTLPPACYNIVAFLLSQNQYHVSCVTD